MKKQFKKLSLNKRTISNLNTDEMNQKVGGAATRGQNCTGFCDNERVCTVGCGPSPTQHGQTCNNNCH